MLGLVAALPAQADPDHCRWWGWFAGDGEGSSTW
jgi:hypothetical protein